MTNASAEIELLTAQNIVFKDPVDGVRTDVAFHKNPLQQRVAPDSKDLEKLLADEAAMDIKFRKFQENM